MTILKSYYKFLNEKRDSAFDDIEYHTNQGSPMFNTSDQFSIDFTHVVFPFFEGEVKESLKRKNIFSNFYKINISDENFLEVLPKFEMIWDGEDLNPKYIDFIFNNPDKVDNLFKSEDSISKFNL